MVCEQNLASADSRTRSINVSNFWPKQRSSRPIRLQEIDYSGSGTGVTTNFGPNTLQVRINSDVRGYCSFGSTTITTSNRDTTTVEIFPNLSGEYFSARAGELISFSSSSTSSGSVFVVEMG